MAMLSSEQGSAGSSVDELIEEFFADDSLDVLQETDFTAKKLTTNNIIVKTKPIVKLSNNPIIYFDLETTGLGYNCEIVQIACICPSENLEFNAYLMPNGAISKGSTSVTGIRKKKGTLIVHGNAVPSTSALEGLRQFITWLKKFNSPPVLVGHNSRNFDAPRLIVTLWNHKLFSEFKKCCVGFSDTLPGLRHLIPGRSNYKLEDLLLEYCNSSSPLMAHNALDDCKALNMVLIKAASVSDLCHAEDDLTAAHVVRETIEKYFFSTDDAFNYVQRCTAKNYLQHHGY